MKVLITAAFHKDGISILEKYMELQYESWKETNKIYFGEEFAEKIKKEGADAVIVEVDLVHEEVLETCDLKFIGCCRAEPLNISVDLATEKGIPVFYTPGRNANAVADLTIAFMLLLLRPILQINLLFKSDKFALENVDDYLKFYKKFTGFELGEKKIGIIGLGAVGFEVAKRLSGFGSEILIFDPYIKDEKIQKINVKKVDLKTLLKEADIVSLHCPVTEDTEKMLGKEEFSLMKETTYFINTARPEIVDEDALYEALKDKKIAGAAIDVFSEEPLLPDNKFLSLENVICTPHIGGATVDVVKHQTYLITKSIEQYLKGEKPDFIYNSEVLSKK